MSQALNGKGAFCWARMPFLAQGKAGFPGGKAGGLLADREGGKVGFYWAQEISGVFQAGLEGGRGLTVWVPSVPSCGLHFTGQWKSPEEIVNRNMSCLVALQENCLH